MNDPYAKRRGQLFRLCFSISLILIRIAFPGRTCVYFQQGKCNRPNCNFSHDLQSETLPVNGTTESSQSSATPSVVAPSVVGSEYPRYGGAYKTKPCRFYARGKCTAGDACRWSHDDGQTAFDEENLQADVPGGFKLVPKSYRSQCLYPLTRPMWWT